MRPFEQFSFYPETVKVIQAETIHLVQGFSFFNIEVLVGVIVRAIPADRCDIAILVDVAYPGCSLAFAHRVTVPMSDL